MKIVADENIPRVREAFSDLGEVVLLPGRRIERKHLLDCQCLLVRTVTPVNAGLLRNTPVEFVGTATIGSDHVDRGFLAQNRIAFSNAPGCNAEAASEYVISGLFALSGRKGFDPFRLKAGIVGCGNVGSRVHRKLKALGITTLINDPPLEAAKTSHHDFVDLDTLITECNFITLHVPLTRDGDYPTYHLFDRRRLDQLAEHCLLVNAARGPVVDNIALEALLDQRTDISVFLDTWENEPAISRSLLQKVDLATPHIAGYSVEGRLRGTQMILDAACQHFGLEAEWKMESLLPEAIPLKLEPCDSDLAFWQQLFGRHHNIRDDHDALTKSTNMTDQEFAIHFDSLRRVYPERYEYERYRLEGAINEKAAAMTRELHFR